MASKLLWLAGIWAASVAVVGAAALLMRALLPR
jgi:hypothetical protein